MKILPVLIIYFSCLVVSGGTVSQSQAVLILARGGSKGMRLKNLQTVGGWSLIKNSVDKARDAGLNDITVSTDHPLIALEAIKCNVSVFHRSTVTASDWAPSIWGAMEFLAQRPDVEILVLMQATSPFIKSEHLRGAVDKIRDPRPFDCIFSVKRSHKLRWQAYENQLHPINFDADRRPRRQDWSGELVETGSFYIARKSLINAGKFQNNNCSVWEIPGFESLEIDTHYDLKVANALLAAGLV